MATHKHRRPAGFVFAAQMEHPEIFALEAERDNSAAETAERQRIAAEQAAAAERAVAAERAQLSLF